MPDRDPKTPYAPPRRHPDARDGAGDGVFDVAAGMLEAVRSTQVQSERRPEAAVGAVGQALRWLTLVAALAAAVVFFWGAYSFPDAPIRESPSGYTGKHGASHSRDEYLNFTLWERGVFVAFGVALALGVAVAIDEAARRRKP